MTFNKDKATTIIGGIMAAGAAAQPVLNGTQGALHTGDYVQLVFAVLLAIQGWLTNKHDAPAS